MADETNKIAGTRTPAQIAGVLIGPLAWALDQIVSYSLVQHACSTGHFYVLHVMTIVFAVIVAGSALMSWRLYQDVREGSDEGGTPFDRSHFLHLLGVVSSVWFFIVIIANAVPRWILSPCD